MELTILRVLWERGPATVREVHEVLDSGKATGYTTVLKLLQIMTAKGMVIRNEDERAHVYEARLPAESTKRQLVSDLVQREDVILCESVQRGLASGAIEHGSLMLSREQGIQHFQRLVHRMLK